MKWQRSLADDGCVEEQCAAAAVAASVQNISRHTLFRALFHARHAINATSANATNTTTSTNATPALSGCGVAVTREQLLLSVKAIAGTGSRSKQPSSTSHIPTYAHSLWPCSVLASPN